MNCRFCNEELVHVFADLHHAPASNSFLTKAMLQEPEVYFPLKVWVCHRCFLVQIEEVKQHNHIFDNNYVYFSSYSSSWLEHSRKFAEMAINRFNLDKNSLVVEIASNDGYLLQYFEEKKIPCLGIEPTANTAQVAKNKGIETLVEFFGIDLANKLSTENKRADLIVGNNVLAHVPDLTDFVQGLSILLKPAGVISLEFPHILQLIKHLQFDTIYHEHFSYFSLFTLTKVFEKFGLEIFDVEELPTHGGSLRIFARHFTMEKEKKESCWNIKKVLNDEIANGLTTITSYTNFQFKIDNLRIEVLHLFSTLKKEGKTIAAYGAAAKGNTMLNYFGIKTGIIDYVVDKSPHKQGKYLPGSHIPVVSEEFLNENKPDYVIILPWNIKDEIMQQLAYMKNWGGKFVILIPEIEIL